MTPTIRLPDVDDETPVDAMAVRRLPRLLDKADDQAILEELLTSAQLYGGSVLKTVGDLIEGLGTLTPTEFAFGVDRLRERAGLPSLKSIEVDEQLERARHRCVTQPIGRLALSPSGGFIDLDEVERDTALEANQATRAERRREAERVERAADVAQQRQRQAAHDELMRRQLPAYLRAS